MIQKPENPIISGRRRRINFTAYLTEKITIYEYLGYVAAYIMI
jgi:hypothetical protein